MDNRKVVFSCDDVVMDFKVSGEKLFSKSKTLRALNHVSFQLYAGESLAVVGESGCGKSTICKVAMRFYKPSSGHMKYLDGEIHQLKGADLRTYREKVQMIFQDPFSALNPLHTIDYHIQRPLKIYHKESKAAMEAKADEYLTMVGLTPPREQGIKFPHELSGGQRQRAYIARVLAAGAEVILADEPTSMLDVSIRLGVLNLLNDLKREHKKSFIYITHDIATARYFADRIIVLYAGHVVEMGEVNKVILEPKHPYTKLLVAAAPDPEKEGKVELPVKSSDETEITMRTPDSVGCPFASRCLEAVDVCFSKMPEKKEISPEQFVCCHKAE
ncbi:MAG: oligopeptide/dipeptide ABC transporter ATP-binding protein [Eubacteriales bacterium]